VGHGRRLSGRLAQQTVDLVDERLALEGLLDVAVGAGGAGAPLVERLEGPGEEDDGDVLERRVPLHRLAHLVPAPPRHHDVGQDDVGLLITSLGDRVLAVVHGDDREVLGRQSDRHDLLDGDAVVGQQ
jgi:hypothetical protein